jgi:hypothetical protein
MNPGLKINFFKISPTLIFFPSKKYSSSKGKNGSKLFPIDFMKQNKVKRRKRQEKIIKRPSKLWVVQGGYCGQKHSVFCTEILKTL